jgi:hypothetical protein
MPSKWERIYRGFFYSLLAAVAAVVLWKVVPVLWEAIVTGGWKARSAFVFLIGWYFALRLAAGTESFRSFVVHWKAKGLLYVSWIPSRTLRLSHSAKSSHGTDHLDCGHVGSDFYR